MKWALACACLFLPGVAYAQPKGGPQWPPPPDAPRLVFVKAYSGLADAAPKGRLGKILRFLLGIVPGRASEARRLIQPTGVYVRGDILYVADPGSQAILKYDEAKRKAIWIGSGWRLKLLSPVGVAANAKGNIFVTDSGLGKVLILDPDGNPVGELRGGPEGFGRPAGLAMAEDRLYVSDSSRHTVSAYDLHGVHLFTFGRHGSGPGEFNFPTYLWFDGKSRQLWVCDSGNFRIQWFDSEGHSLGSLGENGDRPGYLARPRGLALDSDGNIYSTDGALEALQIFDKRGRLLLYVGREGTAPGEFSLPGGIFMDERDRVFVADTFNARVQMFQYLKEKKE